MPSDAAITSPNPSTIAHGQLLKLISLPTAQPDRLRCLSGGGVPLNLSGMTRIWRDIDRRKPNLSPMAICLCLLRLKMEKPKIIAYEAVLHGASARRVMRKYDSIRGSGHHQRPAHRQEMIQKTGQMLQPCVEIDGQMLADVSGEEVEAYMLTDSIVETNGREADAPTNQPCENEMQGGDITFR